MTTTTRPPQAIGEVTRPYEDGERRSFAKNMILCMQGSWLTRRPRQWYISRSKCEEDAAGPVHEYRSLGAGVVQWMTQKETLSNKTMFLIGLIALNKEHLLMSQLYGRFRVPRCNFYGCVVDQLIVDASLRKQAVTAVESLVFPDGSPMFKLEDEEVTAPDNLFKPIHKKPRTSAWLEDDCGGDEEHCPSLLGEGAFGHWSVENRFAYEREWRVLTEEVGL